MDSRIQIVSIVAMAGMFGFVLELVRRRRLMERYALAWLFMVTMLLGLAVFQRPLHWFSSLVGIAYAPSALFAVALSLGMLLLLHFSIAISRLADQNKLLAQRVGQLQQELDELASRDRGRTRIEAAPGLPLAERRTGADRRATEPIAS